MIFICNNKYVNDFSGFEIHCNHIYNKVNKLYLVILKIRVVSCFSQ